MLSPEQSETIAPTLKTIQLICFALIAGVLLATLIFCFVTDWQNVNFAFGTIPLVGAVVAMVLVVQAFIVPGLIGNSAARDARESTDKSSDDRLIKLATAFQTKTIIQYAFLESAALLNLIFFFIFRSVSSLTIVAVAVALMWSTIPRAPSMEDWITERIE